MSLRSILALLTTFAFIQLSKALFYTDSKQNDFPRIGKRRPIYRSEPWSGDSLVTEPRTEMSYGPFKEEGQLLDPMYNKEETDMPYTTRLEDQKPTSSFLNSVYYRVLGRNGFRYLSNDRAHASQDLDVQGSRRYY
ncbi:uncharacterized protein LOC132554637 [Ylistrum balloti]|uniref:uncharacterized protein LOC132554637 n=1 Tax=Ylistrum balloti TaxID=509963 RepID=UPI002905C6BB|nr:uncharacterized protein LOC132554637 [Ylistrum balloti]